MDVAVTAFTAFAFARTNQNISGATLSGGTYLQPLPTSTMLNGESIPITWYDTIPDGTAQVWIATKVFSDDGQGEND